MDKMGKFKKQFIKAFLNGVLYSYRHGEGRINDLIYKHYDTMNYVHNAYISSKYPDLLPRTKEEGEKIFNKVVEDLTLEEIITLGVFDDYKQHST